MPYELYIVRTKDWLAAAENPITKQDVDTLIASDAELSWSNTDHVDMADNTGTVTRYSMIKWRDQPCFWWYRDQILCSSPNDTQISKLVQMARALNAYAVGDDGETYPLEQTPAAMAATFNQPSKKPWPLWNAAFLFGCVLLALKLFNFRWLIFA